MLFSSGCAIFAALAALPACLAAKPIDKRSAQEVIDKLKLVANPEKGYFLETFEDPDKVNNRSVSTLIYYLLEGSAGDSRWHRVPDATEIWHFYAGAPLTLSLSQNDGTPTTKHVLGQDVFNNQAPFVVIPKGTWQSARSNGSWTLVGNTGTSPIKRDRHHCMDCWPSGMHDRPKLTIIFFIVAPGFVTSDLAPEGWRPKGDC